jgi:hypothetical protein
MLITKFAKDFESRFEVRSSATFAKIDFLYVTYRNCKRPHEIRLEVRRGKWIRPMLKCQEDTER